MYSIKYMYNVYCISGLSPFLIFPESKQIYVLYITILWLIRIWASVGVEIAPHIENKFNFSQFSGIAAFCER